MSRYSQQPDHERIIGFYSLWFDDEPYMFSDGQLYECMSFSGLSNWGNSYVYLTNSLSANVCMKGLSMLDIIGYECEHWCQNNKDQILVVYCGKKFNLEMKYDTRTQELVYRSYKENHDF